MHVPLELGCLAKNVAVKDFVLALLGVFFTMMSLYTSFCELCKGLISLEAFFLKYVNS